MYDSLRAVATLGHRRQVEILEINENRNKRQLSVSTAVNYMYPIYNAYTTFASLTGEAEKHVTKLWIKHFMKLNAIHSRAI